MGMRGYIIIGLAYIVTAITGLIENNVLPMLFPPAEYQFAIDSGIAQGYGWPFPFRLQVLISESYNWITYLVDVVIIGLILFAISSGIRKYKRR